MKQEVEALIEDYVVNPNYLSLQRHFCLEIKGKDFSKIIYYDNIIKTSQGHTNTKFRLFINNNKYIYFTIEDKSNYINVCFEKVAVILIFKHSKSVKIKTKEGEQNEYKAFSSYNIDYLFEKFQLVDNFVILNPKGNEINQRQIIDYDSINIQFISKEKDNIDDLFDIKESSPKSEKYSLSLNFDSYFNTKDFNYIETNERKKLADKLDSFLMNNNKNVFCLTGISGIGKSISLLYYLKMRNYSKCYLNIRELYKHYEEKLILNETYKLFKSKEKFKEVIKNIKGDNFWDKLIYILNNLDINPKSMSGTILILDQYKTSYDNNYNNVLKILNKFPNIKIIICSSINDHNLRSNVINSNWIKKNIDNSLFEFYYIEDILIDMRDTIKDNDQLYEFMSLFDYLPKYVNDFLYNFTECTIEAKKAYLNSIMEFYKNNLKKFYFTNKLHLFEKYKKISSIIQTGALISERELNEIIDYLPLKYIKIKKENEKMFNIKYCFPFFSYIFKIYYLEELRELYRLNILTSNKNSQIGNYLDDIVNLKFDINNNVGNITVKHKLIIDRINPCKKVFNLIIDSKDEENVIFFPYLKNEIKKEINMASLFGDHQPIFLEQFFEGKDFDGGLFIPFKGIDGNYNLFLYQTSIHKKNKFTRDYIYQEYIKIKENLENIFGIKIVNGYFSYILYYENPDIVTEIHCNTNFLNNFFYSINNNEFVDSNGKKIEDLLTDNALIYKSEQISSFVNFQNEFNFFKKCIMYSNKNKIKINESTATKKYLNKKIILNEISEKIKDENKIQKLKKNIQKNIELINKIIEFNNSLIEKIDFTDENNINYINSKNINTIDIDEYYLNYDLDKKEEKINILFDKNMPLKEIQTVSNDMKKKLKSEKNKMKNLKEIAKNNKIKFKEISKEENLLKENNIIGYNVREKLKFKKLPKILEKYFKEYTKFVELGNIFFSELVINREIPYFFLFKKKTIDKYCYLIYKNKNEIKKINLDNDNSFNIDDLENYINEQINGDLICHYMKLEK